MSLSGLPARTSSSLKSGKVSMVSSIIGFSIIPKWISWLRIKSKTSWESSIINSMLSCSSSGIKFLKIKGKTVVAELWEAAILKGLRLGVWFFRENCNSFQSLSVLKP